MRSFVADTCGSCMTEDCELQQVHLISILRLKAARQTGYTQLLCSYLDKATHRIRGAIMVRHYGLPATVQRQQ